MEKSSKIYIAGITGMVGGAISRTLKKKGHEGVFGPTEKELDLTSQQDVYDFIDDNPMVWYIAVDGIVLDARYAPPHIQEIAYEQGIIPYIPYLKE